MANEMNLRPPFSPEEARTYGSKGGKASAASRRARRDAKMVAEMVLSMTPDLPPQTLEAMHRMGLSKKGKPDMRMVSTMAIMNRAIKGDYKAYAFILELAGETARSELEQFKAAETRLRANHDSIEGEFVESDMDTVRSKLSTMTDEQLEHYEELCDMFAPDDTEIEGGFVDG